MINSPCSAHICPALVVTEIRGDVADFRFLRALVVSSPLFEAGAGDLSSCTFPQAIWGWSSISFFASLNHLT